MLWRSVKQEPGAVERDQLWGVGGRGGAGRRVGVQVPFLCRRDTLEGRGGPGGRTCMCAGTVFCHRNTLEGGL